MLCVSFTLLVSRGKRNFKLESYSITFIHWCWGVAQKQLVDCYQVCVIFIPECFFPGPSVAFLILVRLWEFDLAWEFDLV